LSGIEPPPPNVWATPSILKLPVKLISPLTSNLYTGEVLLIPILPLVFIVKHLVPLLGATVVVPSVVILNLSSSL